MCLLHTHIFHPHAQGSYIHVSAHICERACTQRERERENVGDGFYASSNRLPLFTLRDHGSAFSFSPPRRWIILLRSCSRKRKPDGRGIYRVCGVSYHVFSPCSNSTTRCDASQATVEEEGRRGRRSAAHHPEEAESAHTHLSGKRPLTTGRNFKRTERATERERLAEVKWTVWIISMHTVRAISVEMHY